MNRLPNIDMPPADSLEIKDLSEDLAVVNEDLPPQEDLSGDPFQRAPAFKPPPPNPTVEKPKKPKRQVSEKQRAHLANARKLARERKLEAKKQKELGEQKIKEVKKVEKKVNVPIDSAKEPVHDKDPEDMSEKEFQKWLKNMDRYADMLTALNKEKRRKQEEAEKKEKEMEAKYFKKFQELQNRLKKPSEQPRQQIPQSSLDLLNKVEEDYGEYSKYF